tara:strand:- start:3468 stop:3851 length:384 start_codon:yes stop_codon:yes gene_type:complete
MKHWASSYLGKEYIKGQQDCWSLFCDVQNNIFNKNVEKLIFGNIDSLAARKQFLNNPLRQRFKEVRIPIEGCAVFMSKGKYTSHIGTYIAKGEGRVLHAIEIDGTIIQTITELKNHGWNITGFYIVE